MQAKLERTLQALECDVPACGVCTVDLARNKKSKKRSGKVTGVDKFGRPLCRYHQPPAKEFIKNADLVKLLTNSTNNEVKQLRLEVKELKEEANLLKMNCGALTKTNEAWAVKEAEYKRRIEEQKNEINTQASALCGEASNKKTEDETSSSNGVNQHMGQLKMLSGLLQ